jgi:hypothetical protein
MPSQRNQRSGSGEEASHILETLRAGVHSKGFKVKLDIGMFPAKAVLHITWPHVAMPSDTTRFRTGKDGRYLFTVFEPNQEGETSDLWEQELPIANDDGKEVGNVAVAVKQVAALE